MKATELRIGNLVKLNNPKYHPDKTGKNFMIDSIKSDDVSLIEYENIPSIILYQYLKYIEPIPLTEEWLSNKFNFKKSEYLRNTFKLNKFEIYIQDGVFWYDLMNDSIEIKSVHHLQNLYFFTQNEELTII